jgi:signal transduction histidine kinase
MILRRNSLWQQLSLIFALIIAIDVAVAAFVADRAFETFFVRQSQAEVAAYKDYLAELVVVGPDGQPGFSQTPTMRRFDDDDAVVRWTVSRAGYPALHSPPQVVRPRARPAQSFWMGLVGNESFRLKEAAALQPPAGGPPVLIEVSAVFAETEIEKELEAEMLLYFVGIGSGTTIAWLAMMAYLISPFRRIRHAIGEVAQGKSNRLTGTYPYEVEPLVQEFNNLMADTNEALNRARLRAGNLAHSVRSPLAIIYDEVEQLEDLGLKSHADAIMGACTKITQRLDSDLSRVRREVANRSLIRNTPVSGALGPVLVAMRRMHADRQVAIAASGDLDTMVNCDAVDLAEILSNLIDNACKWAAGNVVISGKAQGDRFLIVVDDDGPGIPPDVRRRAQVAGQRLDQASPGSGLGLAIAAELCELYGGGLELEDSPLRGLRVVVSLPLAPGETA